MEQIKKDSFVFLGFLKKAVQVSINTNDSKW